MSSATLPLTATPADTLKYQADLVRTGRYEPIGRMMKMSIGDSAKYTRPPGDSLLEKFGRFVDFRHCELPIALSLDNSQLLVTARLLRADCPKCAHQFISRSSTEVCPQCLASFSAPPAVKLPDMPDPFWEPKPWTQDEVEGRARPDPAKTRAPMLEQKLTARCEQEASRPALLEGTDFMIFQPVVRIAFQAENSDGRVLPSVGIITCTSGRGGFESAFLVNYKTGECHFFGGAFVIARRE